MNSRKPVLVAAVLALVATLFFFSVSAQRENLRTRSALTSVPVERLPQLYPVPAFELIDSQGEAFALDRMANKFWVVDFIFTTCAGPCPVMSSRMVDLYEAFADNPHVNFLSISVNPEYDTPEVLAEYAERYNADTSRWHFVTGEREAIHRLAVEGFKLGSVDEPIMHSTRFVLVDATGFIRGYYEATEDDGSISLTRDLALLLPSSTICCTIRTTFCTITSSTLGSHPTGDAYWMRRVWA